MLLKLSIANFILIDSVTITFQEGLNVITGETGSGKSIILAALSFLLGDKADASIIRQGTDFAHCQALFDIKSNSLLFSLLEEAGIDYQKGEELIVKREIQASGKSRIFLNNQSTSLSLVRKIAPHLIEFSGQHTHLKLLNDDEPLLLVDAFADTIALKRAFSKLWQQKNELLKEIDECQLGRESRDVQMGRLALEIEEIESAKLMPDEEETLFSEFQILANREELKQKTDDLTLTIADSKVAIIPTLLRQKTALERLCQLDPTLKHIEEALTSLLAELKEIGYELKRYQTRLEFQPERFQIVDARLKEISQLKRKYGSTPTEITTYLESQKEKMAYLASLDNALDEKNRSLALLSDELESLAKKLSKKRKEKARELALSITEEIISLNMPHALFEIEISHKERGETGDDRVAFLLTPNLGEARIPISEASGGELARVALAIKMVYCDDIPTIVFDEIDANIGGKTAQLIGEKLSTLGKSTQVISITHFAQVALSASSHFRIYKFEKEGRTHSSIEQLESLLEKEDEIKRMLGGVV